MSFLGYIFISFIILVIDQIVKWQIVIHIPLNTTISFIPHILSLSNVRNTGAAWSIFAGQQLLFFIISIIALIVMVVLLKRNNHDKLFALALAFMIGGTLGNFLDRLRLGYVIDMFTLDFINFPIFNIADCALTIGVVLLIIALFKGEDNV
nr:signal peptidase II [uncultured Ligilactobacillus sp.]